MEAHTTSAIPVASRIGGFVYAIRNIVSEARKVEAAGRRVRYLNIGDPIKFGFETPPHLIEAVERALRAGQNGYAPSDGILAAREAVAEECDRRGMPVSPDRVVITSGTSEGIELALTALAEAGDDVLIPVPTYPGTQPYWPNRRARGVLSNRPRPWLDAGPRPHPQRDHAGDPGAGRHRPEQSNGSHLFRRDAASARRAGRSAQLRAPRRRGVRRSRL